MRIAVEKSGAAEPAGEKSTAEPARARPRPEPSPQRGARPESIPGSAVASPAPVAVSEPFVPRGGGEPLPARVRDFFEPRFGLDLGDVRVHTGADAERVNEELGARAVTRGRDIYFGKGEYDSSTREGKELLAHELAHVVQQRGGSSVRGASVGPAGDAFEQEADEVAASVVRGGRARVEKRSDAPGIQRQQARQAQTVTAWPWLWLEPNYTKQDHYPNYTVQTHFAKVSGANFDTLHIVVTAGVSVTVVDLSGMNMEVKDPGGGAARVIVVRIDRGDRKADYQIIQLTFSKGNRVDIVTYRLWTRMPDDASKKAAPKPKEPPEPTFAR
jgi:hypothetical protein